MDHETADAQGEGCDDAFSQWHDDDFSQWFRKLTTDDGGRYDDTVPEWVYEHITDDEMLNLSGQNLDGEIPSWICQLTDLRVLKLSGCGLTGAIPAEMGELNNLEVLDLSGNELSGAIPPELGELDNLEVLDLSGNKLSGAIPPELGELDNLEVLDLGAKDTLNKNQLSGAIPSSLGELDKLDRLDLSENRLSGTIPPALGQLGELEWLDLGGNKLSGAIPVELGQLGKLEWLDLSGNELSGAIPPELGQMGKLEWLNLSENQLSGAISAELDALAIYDYTSVWVDEDFVDDDLVELSVADGTKIAEFESALRVNLRAGERDKDIERELLKNIAALLNTDGGTLIIGADDSGNPFGLANGGFANEDRMVLHLRDVVNEQIGAFVWGKIHDEFVSYDDERVLVIRCDKSNFPIYVGKEGEFYIHTGQGTTSLKPSEIVPYVINHFHQLIPPTEESPIDNP